MKHSITGARVAAVAAVVILGLAGCSSDSSSTDAASTSAAAAATTTTSAPATSSVKKLAPATTTEAPPGPNYTIADYIADENIVETPIHPGDPGAPVINLAFPDGWEDAGDQTPEWAYGAIIYQGPEAEEANYIPSMIAIVSKLEGTVDPQKLIDYAGGEVQNLPGYEAMDAGEVSTLAGFPAYQIGGTYTGEDGQQLVSAQKTVVIPGQDGLYILQINVDGVPDQFGLLASATTAVDEQTTITP